MIDPEFATVLLAMVGIIVFIVLFVVKFWQDKAIAKGVEAQICKTEANFEKVKEKIEEKAGGLDNKLDEIHGLVNSRFEDTAQKLEEAAQTIRDLQAAAARHEGRTPGADRFGQKR